MSRRLVRAALGAALVLIVAPVTGAQAFTVKRFQSPSGKLDCAYVRDRDIPAMIRCEWGGNDRAAVVHVLGRGRIVKVTDTIVDPRSRRLAYGRTRRFGSLRCTSRRTGMTCRSTRSGHGFVVSRERQRTF